MVNVKQPMCVCYTDGDYLMACPLHAAAPALLEALEGGLTAVGLLYGRPFDPIASKATEDFLIAAGAVIRAAKGETT